MLVRIIKGKLLLLMVRNIQKKKLNSLLKAVFLYSLFD